MAFLREKFTGERSFPSAIRPGDGQCTWNFHRHDSAIVRSTWKTAILPKKLSSKTWERRAPARPGAIHVPGLVRRLPAGKGQSIPPGNAALRSGSQSPSPLHPSRNPQTHRGTGILPMVSCPTTNKPPVPRKNHRRSPVTRAVVRSFTILL